MHPSPWYLERTEFVKNMRTGVWLKLRMKTIDRLSWDLAYYQGLRKPRFPVPAIPVITGYHQTGTGGMRGVPYLWLMYGYNRLTTFWKGYDPIIEWYDTDGKRHIRRVVSMSKRDA